MLQVVAYSGCAFAQGVAPTTGVIGTHDDIERVLYRTVPIHMYPHRGREHITNLLHNYTLHQRLKQHPQYNIFPKVRHHFTCFISFMSKRFGPMPPSAARGRVENQSSGFDISSITSVSRSLAYSLGAT